MTPISESVEIPRPGAPVKWPLQLSTVLEASSFHRQPTTLLSDSQSYAPTWTTGCDSYTHWLLIALLPLHILFSWGTELKVWMKATEKETKSHNRWVHFGSGIPYSTAWELPVGFIATLRHQVLLMGAHKLKVNCMCYHRVICMHSECMTKVTYQ